MTTHRFSLVSRSRRLVGVALVAAVFTAGCGSTVQIEGTQRVELAPGDALGQPGVGGDPLGQPVVGDPTSPGTTGPGGAGNPLTGVPTTSGGTTGGSGTPVGGGSTGGGGTSGGSAGNGGNGGGTGGGNGSGGGSPFPVETGPLKVGLVYATGVDAVATALGLGGLTTGDTKAQATAIVNNINARGGVAGRRIDLRLAPISAADASGGQAAALQAACTKLTQDDKVAFAVSYIGLMEGTMACFAKAGVGVLNDNSTLSDAVMNQYATHFAAPGDIAPGRLMKVLVDSLWRTGWLTKSSKVGVFSYDDDRSRAITNGPLKAALAAKGVSIKAYQQVSASAAGITQASASVLKYRSAGVDRIIPVLASPLFLMQGAQSQGYRPRYALYSNFGPGALIETAAPRSQLAGAAGIGWSPYLDIGKGVRGPAVSSNATLCFQIMEGAGLRAKGATQAGFQSQLCNSFFYLAHAAKKVGGAPSDLLGRARAAVGTSFAPADTFKTDVTNRPDGVAAYRDLTFSDGCRCFQYGATHSAG